MAVEHIRPFQVRHVGIPQRRKAAETKYIPYPFEGFLLIGERIIVYGHQFRPVEENDLFLGSLQLRFEINVVERLTISLYGCPA